MQTPAQISAIRVRPGSHFTLCSFSIQGEVSGLKAHLRKAQHEAKAAAKKQEAALAEAQGVREAAEQDVADGQARMAELEGELQHSKNDIRDLRKKLKAAQDSLTTIGESCPCLAPLLCMLLL